MDVDARDRRTVVVSDAEIGEGNPKGGCNKDK